MIIIINNRKAEVEIEMNREAVDCYIAQGVWLDDGEALTEAELFEAQFQNQAEVEQYACENGALHG